MEIDHAAGDVHLVPNWPIQRLRSERPELRRRELVLYNAHSQRPTVIQCTSGATTWANEIPERPWAARV